MPPLIGLLHVLQRNGPLIGRKSIFKFKTEHLLFYYTDGCAIGVFVSKTNRYSHPYHPCSTIYITINFHLHMLERRLLSQKKRSFRNT